MRIERAGNICAVALLLVCLSACDSLSEKLPWLHAKPSLEGVVATVGTHVLYEDDIRSVTRGAVTVDDSIAMAEQYIRSWATQWLLYDNAKQNLGGRPQLDQLVENYRRSLYVHEYEQLLIANRMSTDIPLDSMLAYYENYGDKLILEEDVFRGIMLILPKDSPQQYQLRKWLAKSESEIENIESYAYQNAIGYQFFVEEWQPLQKILLNIPADEKKVLYQLKYHNLLEVKNEGKIYLLQTTDKRFAGEQMPFDYAQPYIMHILLEQRKRNFLNDYEQQIYSKWASTNTK